LISFCILCSTLPVF